MPAFQDFDLDLLDGTADLESPVPLATFASGADPESGTLDVAAGTLLVVRARAVAGAGTYDLTLTGLAVSTTGLASGARASLVVPGASRAVPGGDSGAYARPAGAFVAGEAVVSGLPGREADLAAEVERRGGRVLEASPSGVVRVAFDVPPGADEEDAARTTIARVRGLSGGRSLAYAEPNHLACASEVVPDDAHWEYHWHHRMIRLPEAWEISTGSPDVVVAVLDTGRTNHPDLAGRQVGGYDFISSPSMARDGNGRDPDPTDPGDLAYGNRSSFHGTHVAGTIGAATNNALGVSGVTWDTQVLHLRVLGVGGGTFADIAEAVRYAARLPNASGTLPTVRADVINMSLGGGGFSQAMQDAVTAARNAGVVVFAAAGNSARSQPSYPAALDGVVSVIALNSAKGRAWYSNFGPTCDLSAPGGDSGLDLDQDGLGDGVLSTIYDDSTSPFQPAYVISQGTSMACPHAAGVAALLRAVDPDLTPAEIEGILFSTAQDLGAPGRDDAFGHGLLDAFEALSLAAGVVVPTIPPRLALFPGSVVFSGSATVADVAISNAGGGLLTVDSAVAETTSGGAWLSATLLGPGDASKTARVVALAVDRSGLPPGTYVGKVTVSSDGGTEVVPVALEVGIPAPPLPDVDIRVRAVRADTGEVVQETVVNPTSGLDWSFPTLPAGEYVFVASTDVDRDGGTCEDGDWCGAFPLVSDPEPVLVLANTHLPNVDFRVTVTRILED
jgi:serine protease